MIFMNYIGNSIKLLGGRQCSASSTNLDELCHRVLPPTNRYVVISTAESGNVVFRKFSKSMK